MLAGYAFGGGMGHDSGSGSCANVNLNVCGKAIRLCSSIFAGRMATKDCGCGYVNGTFNTRSTAGILVGSYAFTGGGLSTGRSHTIRKTNMNLCGYASTAVRSYAFTAGVVCVSRKCNTRVFVSNAGLRISGAAFRNNCDAYGVADNATNGNNTVCTSTNSALAIAQDHFLSNNCAPGASSNTCGANVSSVSTCNATSDPAAMSLRGILVQNMRHNRVFHGTNTACGIIGYAVTNYAGLASASNTGRIVCGRGGKATIFGGGVVCNGSRGLCGALSVMNSLPAFRCYALRRAIRNANGAASSPLFASAACCRMTSATNSCGNNCLANNAFSPSARASPSVSTNGCESSVNRRARPRGDRVGRNCSNNATTTSHARLSSASTFCGTTGLRVLTCPPTRVSSRNTGMGTRVTSLKNDSGTVIAVRCHSTTSTSDA